jgi:hypothetical protein
MLFFGDQRKNIDKASVAACPAWGGIALLYTLFTIRQKEIPYLADMEFQKTWKK